MKTQEELIKEIENLKKENDALKTQIENLQNKAGRKSEVLNTLRKNKSISIVAISELLGISTKNVSSQLTYLRQDGYNICTDVNGKKFLVEK
jgi:biotin operon repressor